MYEIPVDFFSNLLGAGVWQHVSGFWRGSDNAEDIVYLHTRWQSRGVHDESGWLRTGELNTASRY